MKWWLQNFKSQAQAWTPSDEAELAFWLDSTDESTITKDGSNLVSNFNHRNGLYGSFTAATTARPTWTPSVQNGQPMIYFDGANNFMTGPSTILSGLDVDLPFWGFLVFKPESKLTDFNTWFSIPANDAAEISTIAFRKFAFTMVEGNASYQTAWQCITGTTGADGSGTKTGVRNDGVNFTDGSTNIYMFSFNGGNEQSAADWTMHKNSTSQSLTASGTGTAGTKTSYLAAWVDGSLRAKGYFGEECLFTNSSLDETKRANALAYILSKWAV